MKNFLKTVLYFVLGIVFALGIRHYVASSFAISGASMAPTLKEGQQMFMYKLASPNRFDIVIIESPDNSYDENGNIRSYIKRVIGMPGDTVEYRNDILYINGQAYEEPYLDELKQSIDSNQRLTPDFTLESLMTRLKVNYPNLPEENTRLAYRDGIAVIPDGYYLVLGDNRRFSKDSDEFGLVNANKVEGIAVLRYWPLTDLQIAPFN